jgi:adenosylhomocysteine nucleosidase
VLALLSAMEEEIATVVETLSGVTTHAHGGRRFHVGRLHGQAVVVVFSRLGKVAAAATATQLIAAFPVSALVFSGVAGAVQRTLAIGDVVVATELIQHDMDASPIFPRYEVPLLGMARFPADPELAARLQAAAHEFVGSDLAGVVAHAELEHFGIRAPQVVGGLIASGDKFFASRRDLETLRRELPDTACVEMEGAAVAQVCAEYRVRCAVVRTLSDAADESSPHDFPRFARNVARHYSAGILARFLRSG